MSGASDSMGTIRQMCLAALQYLTDRESGALVLPHGVSANDESRSTYEGILEVIVDYQASVPRQVRRIQKASAADGVG